MQTLTLVLFAGVLATALAAGQYYVPRAYFTIDGSGHESAPVPLRRLRRSTNFIPPPQPYRGGSSAHANANANANSWSSNGGSASANANANANAGADGRGHGDWYPGGGSPGAYPGAGWADAVPSGYGASNPGYGTYGASGPVNVPSGGGLSVSSTADLDSSGHGYYDHKTSIYPQ